MWEKLAKLFILCYSIFTECAFHRMLHRLNLLNEMRNFCVKRPFSVEQDFYLKWKVCLQYLIDTVEGPSHPLKATLTH